jgi:hypothetical protein
MSTKDPPSPPPPSAVASAAAAHIPHYPPAREAALLKQSYTLKAEANTLFTTANYSGALTGYEQAVASLPSYLDFEMAVLRSNIAACFVKLEEWKRCVEEADKGLEALDAMEKEKEGEGDERVVEIEDEEIDGDEGADDDATVVAVEGRKIPSEEDVLRIRTKLLLRRAKAKTEMGGWADLQAAQEG